MVGDWDQETIKLFSQRKSRTLIYPGCKYTVGRYITKCSEGCYVDVVKRLVEALLQKNVVATKRRYTRAPISSAGELLGYLMKAYSEELEHQRRATAGATTSPAITPDSDPTVERPSPRDLDALAAAGVNVRVALDEAAQNPRKTKAEPRRRVAKKAKSQADEDDFNPMIPRKTKAKPRVTKKTLR
eukprot:SAG31_NODE_12663_length_926_cov_0.829504_1_plen_185_part_10